MSRVCPLSFRPLWPCCPLLGSLRGHTKQSSLLQGCSASWLPHLCTTHSIRESVSWNWRNMFVHLFCLCLPWVTKTGKLSLWIKSEVLFPDSSKALWEMSCKWYLWIGLWDWMKIKQNIYVGMEACAYSLSHSAGWGRRIVRTVTTQQSSWLMCFPLLFPVPLHLRLPLTTTKSFSR